MNALLLRRLRLIASLSVGLVYGLLSRLIIGAIQLNAPSNGESSPVLATMSLAFIFATPLVVGTLTVFLAPQPQRSSGLYAILAPILAISLVLVAFIVFQIELLICAAMLFPVFALMAVIGGVLAMAITRAMSNQSAANRNVMMSVIALLPVLSAPLESMLPMQTSVETVVSAIDVAAPAQTVWDNVVRVREIQPGERRWTLAYAAGIPSPVKATLDRDGLGGLRQGEFDNGLIFHEVINVWEPARRVRFSIKPYAPSVYAPFDNIGRQYLDLVDAEYRITDRGTAGVRLELISRHRVSTRYNAYSTLLTRTFMGQFQDDLLRIIKARCEGEGA